MNSLQTAAKLTLFSVFFASLGSVSWGESSQYSGELFKEGTKRTEKLYSLNIQIADAADGTSSTVATYKDLSGQVMVEEKGQLKGSELVRYDIDHVQSGQKGSVEVRDGRVYFSKTEDGKTTTSDEKLGSTLVISANYGRFVKNNWDKLKSGKEVEFRYAVWQRKETVGFELFKIGEEKIGDQNAIVVKMKPSSFIIAALVKPLILKYSEDGSKLLELIGRVPPMQKSGSSWKDLDAEVLYTHPAASAEIKK